MDRLNVRALCFQTPQFLEVGLDPQNIPNTKPEEVFERLGTKQPKMLKLESFTETTLKSAFFSAEAQILRLVFFAYVFSQNDGQVLKAPKKEDPVAK